MQDYNGPAKVPDKSVMDQLITEFEVQNKQCAELTYRLEKIGNRIAEDGNEAKGSEVSQPSQSIPGHLTNFKNTIEYYRSVNNRLAILVEKLEKLI